MGSRANLQILVRAAMRRAESVAAFLAMLLGLAIVVSLHWHGVGIVVALSGAGLLLGGRELLAATLRERTGAEYRELAMSMPVGVVRRDRHGRLTFINRELLTIAGLAPDTAVGDISASLFHPGDREPAVAAMEQTLRTGRPYEHELRVLRPDGEVRFVVVRGSVQPGVEGPDYLATVTDITERRAAERAARVEMEHQRALMAAMPAGILRMDVDAAWVYVNDRFREVWHLTPEQAPGAVDWSPGVHPDDRERVARDWGAAIAGDGVYEDEFRIVAPDGSWRWTWTRAVPEEDEAGNRIGFVAAVLDVHERRSAEAALSRSERLHRLTINSLPGVLVGLYDRDLRCVLMEGDASSDELNTAVCAGRTLAEFANRETADRLEPGMRAAILEGREESYEYRSPRDGSFRENHVGPLRTAEGEIEGVVIVSHDITEQRLVEDARRTADEQFRIAFDHAPIGIVSIDLDGSFHRVNQSLCDMSGHTADELLALSPLSIVHVDDRAAVRARIGEIEVADTVAIEHRITHAHGHTAWVDTRVALIRDEHGKPMQMLAQVQDINDRRHYEQRLEHMADHDPLTGLLNRRGLERELEAQLARARRYPCGGTLAVIDLDGFKHVNDTLGHAAGDTLIAGIADALRQRLRETDVIARMGGDEFAVILPTESPEKAAIVARTLLTTLREHAAELVGQHPGRVTASIGLAAFEGHLTADQMFVRADRAMYSAKEAGKDRYAQYTEIPVLSLALEPAL